MRSSLIVAFCMLTLTTVAHAHNRRGPPVGPAQAPGTRERAAAGWQFRLRPSPAPRHFGSRAGRPSAWPNPAARSPLHAPAAAPARQPVPDTISPNAPPAPEVRAARSAAARLARARTHLVGLEQDSRVARGTRDEARRALETAETEVGRAHDAVRSASARRDAAEREVLEDRNERRRLVQQDARRTVMRRAGGAVGPSVPHATDDPRRGAGSSADRLAVARQARRQLAAATERAARAREGATTARDHLAAAEARATLIEVRLGKLLALLGDVASGAGDELGAPPTSAAP